MPNPSVRFFPHTPIAHRGNCGEQSMPENTLLSIATSHQHGVTWIECDVKLTADGMVVVIHDDTLKRTTNVTDELSEHSVSKLNYQDILKFDTHVNGKYSEEKIPTLSQFLQLITQLNLGLIIEIKPSPGLEVETAKKVIEILINSNLLHYPLLLIQSFCIESLQIIKSLQVNINLGLIIADVVTQEVINILTDLNCIALIAKHDFLNLERVTYLKQLLPLLNVLAWTVDDVARAEELFTYGVDALISDHPERFLNNTKRF